MSSESGRIATGTRTLRASLSRWFDTGAQANEVREGDDRID